MKRRIIKIDEAKCSGCGACAEACHEGAIGMVNGKAKLLRDDYCDGLGDCLPTCPEGAIGFEEREALPYDEAAVKAKADHANTHEYGGCPGSAVREMNHGEVCDCKADEITSRLSQWPVQIKLAPVSAQFFNDARLLIAADCTAFAYGDFHRRFIDGNVVLVGCPKLDNVDYSEKLTEIFAKNKICEIIVVRMEVPCCGGLEYAVKQALEKSGKDIAVKVVTISIKGDII